MASSLTGLKKKKKSNYQEIALKMVDGPLFLKQVFVSLRVLCNRVGADLEATPTSL